MRKTPKRLTAEERERERTRPWPCAYCDHVSIGDSDAKRHRNSHPPEERVLTCETCGLRFMGRASAFKRHQETHDPAYQEQRFWARVDQDGPIPDYAPHLGPCWIWTASINSKGYGNFKWPGNGDGKGGKYVHAHQYAYVTLTGKTVPEGYELDHLCRVTRCVRTDHLEPVPHRVNSRRGRDAAPMVACPDCGKECRGKAAMRGHQRFVHEGMHPFKRKIAAPSGSPADD